MSWLPILLLLQLATAQDSVLLAFNDQTVSVTGTSAPPPDEIEGAVLHSALMSVGVSIYQLPENVSATEFCASLPMQDYQIQFCEPDSQVRLDQSTSLSFTNDPLLAKQYYMGSNGVQQVWNQGVRGNQTVRVCIMDSGYDTTHPDLQQNQWVNAGEVANNSRDDDGNGIADDVHGASFINGASSGSVEDQNGHGTLVSGLIGATVDNQMGIAGMLWNVSLMMCKFMDATGNGQLSDAVSCYNYCLEERAHIIHNSWGSTQYSQALSMAFGAISTRAIPVITSAGNDGVNTDSQVHYPSGFSGQYPTVLSTAALDTKLSVASLSNYGKKTVQLGAPGITIQGLDLRGGYTTESGTSFAAPQVTATAALLYGYLANNRSINIDTQNVATLVVNAILNGTKPYPMTADQGKTANGYLYAPGALDALIAGLAAQDNQTTAISGPLGIVVGIIIGLVVMFFVMSGIFFVYLRFKKRQSYQ